MQKTALKFIWNYLSKFKLVLFGVVFLSLIARGVSQISLLYIAKTFDWIATGISQPNYWHLLIGLLVLCISLDFLGQVLQALSMWFACKLIPHLRSLVIKDVFAYVNKHSISYFTNEMAGNISNKFNQLQNGVVDFFFHCGNGLFDFCFMFVNLIILSYINWILGIVVFIWVIMMFFIGRHFGYIRADLSRKTSTEQSKSNAMIVDSIANYSEIKSFANYKYERINMLKTLRIWRHTESKEQKQKCLINMYLGISATLSTGLIMLISTALFYYSHIDVASFFFILTVSHRLSGVIFGVNWIINGLSRTLGQIDSALITLAKDPEIIDKANAKPLIAKSASIKFDSVCFAYNNNQPIFNNFCLEIKEGEKIGIVGTSGSGKSTLIKLIARYFDVSSGSITINGVNIQDVTQDSLHKHISTIPQDVCLFNRSLLDNIRYGKTDATDQEVFKAAKQASADKFINKFANKYNTKVGDRGVILSGGERQRIAIARAILKNAPILIFDEATSSLDSESEKYIQTSLKTLMKNKTVVAIAHRLSTLREMDRIIVLENGQIVEQGTHLSLLRKKGRYAKLFKMQSDGYIQVS